MRATQLDLAPLHATKPETRKAERIEAWRGLAEEARTILENGCAFQFPSSRTRCRRSGAQTVITCTRPRPGPNACSSALTSAIARLARLCDGLTWLYVAETRAAVTAGRIVELHMQSGAATPTAGLDCRARKPRSRRSEGRRYDCPAQRCLRSRSICASGLCPSVPRWL